MTKQADIINFVLRKKIDRIQLTIKHPWFEDVLQRSMLFLNHDSEAEYKKRTIWNFNHKHDDRKTLNIISHKEFPATFSLIATNLDLEFQNTLIKDILHDAKRNLAQIEFAYDLYSDNIGDLIDARDIICSGLTLKMSRGLGFRRELGDDAKAHFKKLKKHSYEDFDDTNDTLYYGSNHFVRNNTDPETGKNRSVSKGLTIYLKPKNTYQKKYLRLEIRLNNEGIKSYINQHQQYQSIIDAEIVKLETFLRYRFFDYKKLLNSCTFREKKQSIRTLHRYSSERRRDILLNTQSTVVQLIKHPKKLHDKVSNSDIEAAMPVQIMNFKKIFRELKSRSPQFFPPDKDKQRIVEDIENGFVRRTYYQEQDLLAPNNLG